MIRKRIVASMNDMVLVLTTPGRTLSSSSENNVILLFPEHLIFHSNNIFEHEKSTQTKSKFIFKNNPSAVFNARKSVMSLKVNVILKF